MKTQHDPAGPPRPGPGVVVAVVGPTATGKSDLALDLAERLSVPGAPAEIVNADAYQLYRGMDVGTAKVPVAERRGVHHHLLDVLDPAEDASVARYQAEARRVLDDIAARGARAVVVGGSGLYVRALLDDMRFPGTDPAVRAALEARAEEQGPRALHDELLRRDPAAAASIGPANTRRLVRALEVMELTGEPFTANLPRQVYVRPTVQIGLDCDRAVLDARVAGRVERMWEQGLVAEVRRVEARGMGRTARRAVGYAEVLAALHGESTEDAAREAVTANTRRLARKQMGWFGRDPRVGWLDAQSPTRVEDALALVAAADERAATQGRDGRGPGSVPGTAVGPDEADSGAPVRRSLGS
ncbi:tRNA (adenosine(37)-N6)-dimethylallyltransferase MiaA [Cellulosimicrobium cellulans]|uniref:tRNA (adenosine(37)-N6)-dimethylallyltransferase MiaA n=1 Tax=Cellulosimicrobium cellulans TaxID=1710 RepID=UPI0018847A22|nr:tRNA (adenosine(37)-N6)-dimethylallyltransferase MiaA [Cellulosimicrobium cellulans]MBE9925013.1 tRNA (adenosine(37)-N6)-dimethylallyltransferase MiaA [Cellulosimicrobium cellulans]